MLSNQQTPHKTKETDTFKKKEKKWNSAESLRGRDSKRLKLFVHKIYFMRTNVFTVGQSQPAESCECVELLGLAVSLFRLSAVRSLFARALHGATWNLRGRCVCVCVCHLITPLSAALCQWHWEHWADASQFLPPADVQVTTCWY